MEIQWIHVLCLILILVAILIGIGIIKYYDNKTRLEELEHEKQIAALRQQSMEANMQLSSVRDIAQSLAKSNVEIITAWIGKSQQN